jgi:putative copper resistance protein D
MTGFVDVVLRGLILALASLVLGGVVWTRWIIGVAHGAAPAPAARRALRVVALAGVGVALAQLGTLLVSLAALAGDGWPVAAFLTTTFARAALVRIGVAVAVAVLAGRLAIRPTGRAAWHGLTASALALVVTSAVLSHAVARVDGRASLLVLDAVHQLAAAIWIGGLAHLVLWLASTGPRPQSVGAWAAASTDAATVVRRFSNLALGSVIALLAAGLALAWRYLGDGAALVETAYGVMVLSKAALLGAILILALANLRTVRRAGHGIDGALRVLVEVELGLGLTVLFAAASLTSLPPAIDVTADRASAAEVAARFRPTAPRLTSPPVAELIATAEPLMAPVSRRTSVERAWSEYNHHWAGVFVLAMGSLAALERLGVRTARHWPLLFLGLAAFLVARSDPRAWPLGPAGFWESLALPDVLQHRAFVVLVVAFGVFEWMVRTDRLPPRPWAYVFPMLAAVGCGLLLTHSHAMFSVKDEFLGEVTHAPLGILGGFVGWGRWVELRLPVSGRGAGWLSTGCLIMVGLLLVVYREP